MATKNRLLEQAGLDFAAADFKRGPDGRLRFLEVNNQPMFAAFDRAAEGALGIALLRWLGGASAASEPARAAK